MRYYNGAYRCALSCEIVNRSLRKLLNRFILKLKINIMIPTNSVSYTVPTLFRGANENK